MVFQLRMARRPFSGFRPNDVLIMFQATNGFLYYIFRVSWKPADQIF